MWANGSVYFDVHLKPLLQSHHENGYYSKASGWRQVCSVQHCPFQSQQLPIIPTVAAHWNAGIKCSKAWLWKDSYIAICLNDGYNLIIHFFFKLQLTENPDHFYEWTDDVKIAKINKAHFWKTMNWLLFADFSQYIMIMFVMFWQYNVWVNNIGYHNSVKIQFQHAKLPWLFCFYAAQPGFTCFFFIVW